MFRANLLTLVAGIYYNAYKLNEEEYPLDCAVPLCPLVPVGSVLRVHVPECRERTRHAFLDPERTSRAHERSRQRKRVLTAPTLFECDQTKKNGSLQSLAGFQQGA